MSVSPNKKILIFTAFADTAVYLYKYLHQWVHRELKTHIALVTGGSSPNETTLGEKRFQNILVNFLPIAKNRSQIQGF